MTAAAPGWRPKAKGMEAKPLRGSGESGDGSREKSPKTNRKRGQDLCRCAFLGIRCKNVVFLSGVLQVFVRRRDKGLGGGFSRAV